MESFASASYGNDALGDLFGYGYMDSRHQRMSETEFLRAARTPNVNVLMLVAQNRFVQPHLLRQVCETYTCMNVKENYALEVALVSHRNCPVDVLEKFVYSSSSHVRCQVANHPSTPATVLELLEKVGPLDATMAYSFADHPNTPIHMLRRLVVNGKTLLRVRISKRSDLTLDVFEVLHKDKEVTVRTYVAQNDRIPSEFLRELAKDSTPGVRQSVAGNRNASRDTLEQLAEDDMTFVRHNVARNLSTPPEVLYKLATDHDHWVREAVRMNPNSTVRTRTIATITTEQLLLQTV